MQDFALLGTALDCDFDHDIPGKAASFQPVEHVQRWVKAGQDSYTRPIALAGSRRSRPKSKFEALASPGTCEQRVNAQEAHSFEFSALD